MDALSTDQACFIVIKARQFDAKDALTDPNEGSNPSDDAMTSVLEDNRDDPVVDELTAFIQALNEDQQCELVALVWLGRGDYTADDFAEVLDEARNAHNDRTAEYLLGIPLLGDYLERGLDILGFSCADYDMQHL